MEVRSATHADCLAMAELAQMAGDVLLLTRALVIDESLPLARV